MGEDKNKMSVKSRVGEAPSKISVPRNWALLLCVASFCFGILFTNRISRMPEPKDTAATVGVKDERINLLSEDHDQELKAVKQESSGILGDVSNTHHDIQTLDKTISNLEVELAAAKAAHESMSNGPPLTENLQKSESTTKRKYLMVVGINTAFTSRRRRDSVRATWMPQGEKRKKLEEERGILIRFVIGHSSSKADGILDKAIESEHSKYGDFLRLEHIEGYLELSAKTRTYFATAVALWDADFYVKVDDDIHVNIATLGMTLLRHRSKPRVYIGCMKSGPVLHKKGVKYHEPEYWKFGEEGNKYFRHATGQLYAISKDLATYISINQQLLHKYANEDVSLGAWFIGLDVEHVDDRRLCCGTPPDCEWKAQAGNICIASFDWRCSGICKSVERMKFVHQRCAGYFALENGLGFFFMVDRVVRLNMVHGGVWCNYSEDMEIGTSLGVSPVVLLHKNTL
ncbi:probable beta-1,3-galactosyltransferase 2 [Malania oleifera]|uniref:probable beta-1,3-galactosyltransferase 2 n=1 Tax=Malania oleifera TaxID=397392 RepID=UPI0025ADB3B9|nr:probable beta-1,3-galactosyltransferase 2 [Malania oleifera]